MKLVPETTKDFGFLKIFDLYSQTELENIWREILHLDYVLDLTIDDDPYRGKQLDGTSKMSGEGLFVDHVYTNREYSPILTYNRRLFLDEEINKRNITDNQIKECIDNSKLDPQDQLMVSRYIYSDLDVLNNKIGQS